MKILTSVLALLFFTQVLPVKAQPRAGHYQLFWSIIDYGSEKTKFRRDERATVDHQVRTILEQLGCSNVFFIKDSIDEYYDFYDVTARCPQDYTFGIGGNSPMTAFGAPNFNINGRAINVNEGVARWKDNREVVRPEQL